MDIKKCGDCGGPVDTQQKMEKVPYGRPIQFTLEIEIPVHKCKNSSCAIEFYDMDAEELIDNAIKVELAKRIPKQ